MAYSLRILFLTLVSVMIFTSQTHAIDPIVVKGSKFFYKTNGTQFFVKGVYYRFPILPNQVGGDMASFVDPLADERACQRDIPFLVNLGINTLVIDGYNADREHQRCMQLLSDAGIYVLVAINGYSEVAYQFNGTVGTPISYVAVNHFFKATDFFRRWNNTLGLVYFMQDVRDLILGILPLQKRYLGETKEYMRSRGYRDIPLGVAGNEWVPKRYNMPQYMACDDEESAAADFYLTWPRDSDFVSWCSNATSRLRDIKDNYQDFPRPLILSYGCPKDKALTVEQHQEIDNSFMTDTYSGAVFHEWFDHGTLTNEMFTWSTYAPGGLVNINGTNVIVNRAYSALSNQLAKSNLTSTHISDTSPAKPLPCEDFILKKGEQPINVTEDYSIKAVLPPKSSSRLCNCMMDTLTCVSNPDTVLQTNVERLYALWQTCKWDPSDPQYCFGYRTESQNGLYDSFIHCNGTEKLSWGYDRASNSSEMCTALDGIVKQPTPTASLAPDCQVLLRQAGPSGTGTVTYFPSDATSTSTTQHSESRGLSSREKGGIGVGVVAFLLAIIGGLLVCRRVKRKATARKKEAEAREALEAEADRYQKVELADTAKPVEPVTLQLHSNEIYELDSPDHERHEADDGAKKIYIELAGDIAIKHDDSEGVVSELPNTEKPNTSEEKTGR